MNRLRLREYTIRYTSGPWPSRLPFIASLILVILLAHQLAGITWSLLAERGEITVIPATQTRIPHAGQALDPERVARRSIFGRADQTATPVQVEDAPDTNLNLHLRGILAASNQEDSRVVIADGQGRERVYAVGAAVPGGATVHEILTDRVLLDRRGTLETLRLPKPGDDSGAPTTAARVAAPAPMDNLADAAGVQDSGLAEVIRPQAVMVDNRLHGFRIYPGRDRQRFATLGLRAGDLVTAINGVMLDDPVGGLDALQALAGSDQVTITVNRGGRDEDITVDLQQR